MKKVRLLSVLLLLALLVGCGEKPVGDIPEIPDDPVEAAPVETENPERQKTPKEPKESTEPLETEQPKFEYIWDGEVKQTYDFVMEPDIVEWLEPLTPWWVLTDADAPMVPPDGYQVYALKNGDRCYPVITFEPFFIEGNDWNAYQGGFSISVWPEDGSIYYNYDIVSDTNSIVDSANAGWEIYTDGEFVITQGNSLVAGGVVRHIFWFQKFDTGLYLKGDVFVKGEENFDKASEFCSEVWGLDVDSMLSSVKPHDMTFDDMVH